jgi:hypothetical protein
LHNSDNIIVEGNTDKEIIQKMRDIVKGYFEAAFPKKKEEMDQEPIIFFK